MLFSYIILYMGEQTSIRDHSSLKCFNMRATLLLKYNII